MKAFFALFALLAVAAANPLPLVQIIVNVDAPGAVVGEQPAVAIEKPEVPAPGLAVAELPILDFIHEEEVLVPAPVQLPEAVLPEVVLPEVNPEPAVLPEPVLPVVIPEPALLPEPVLPVLIPEPVILPETLN